MWSLDDDEDDEDGDDDDDDDGYDHDGGHGGKAVVTGKGMNKLNYMCFYYW